MQVGCSLKSLDMHSSKFFIGLLDSQITTCEFVKILLSCIKTALHCDILTKVLLIQSHQYQLI